MLMRPTLFIMITVIFMNSFTFSIAEISNNKVTQENAETTEIKEQSWFEKNKTACMIAGGIACFTLAAIHVYLQIFFLKEYMRQEREKTWEAKLLAACEGILRLEQEGRKVQDQQYEMQKEQLGKQEEQYAMQKEQLDKQKEQYARQTEQYWVQINQYLTQFGQFSIDRKLGHIHHDEYVKCYNQASKERQQTISGWDSANNDLQKVVLSKLDKLEKSMRTNTN